MVRVSAQLHPTRGYIGGGNIAGILGLSPFRSPLDEYLLIVNEMQDDLTPEQEEFFEDRRDLEPWAAKKFTRKTGLQVLRQNVRYEDSEFSWARAEVDFEPEDDSNGETKSVHPIAAGKWGKPDDGNEPPPYVTAQAMWGMGITGRSKCYVQALVGFDDYRLFVIERDDELIQRMRDAAAGFWKYNVQSGHMPQPINLDDVLRLYARDSGRVVEADAEIVSKVLELTDLRQQGKLLDSKRELVELAIKSYMRDASTLTIRGLPALTWRTQERTTLDTDDLRRAYPEIYDQFKTTTSTRVLRIK